MYRSWLYGGDTVSSYPARLVRYWLHKVFNLLSTNNKWRITCRAHHLHLQLCQEEAFFCLVTHQVNHLRNFHVCRGYRCIKFTSVRYVSEDFRIPNFGKLFCAQIEEPRGQDVSRLVLRHDQNVLIVSIFNELQNGLLYYRQPFHLLSIWGLIAR